MWCCFGATVSSRPGLEAKLLAVATAADILRKGTLKKSTLNRGRAILCKNYEDFLELYAIDRFLIVKIYSNLIKSIYSELLFSLLILPLNSVQ